MHKFKKAFNNKKILITGHTGFKGSWLALWLKLLGAKVVGISKDIPTKPSNFLTSKVDINIKNIFCDIANLKEIKKNIKKNKPDYLFHLAAQSLVKKSYDNPIETWCSNLIGTLNVLESLRYLKKKCTVVIITSDKCYKNFEKEKGYKEDDVLGGNDPYSASKGAAEIVIQSYVKSFFSSKDNNIRIAIGRAGNVIGGGDWSEHRLIPDCVKSWSKNKNVLIRSLKSTRPWQHVLEALSGYLCLANFLNKNPDIHGEAFNFGPSNKNNFSVSNLLKKFKSIWKEVGWKKNSKKIFKESKLLKLNSNKAKKILKWRSVLSFNQIIQLTADWYKHYYLESKNMHIFSKLQIEKFMLIYQKKIK